MILGGCIQSSLTNRCDCETACWKRQFDNQSDFQACLDTCASTSTTCGTACTSAFSGANDSLSTTASDCASACSDAETSCIDSCGGGEGAEDCITACGVTFCQCGTGCQIAFYEGLSDPQNTQVDCNAACCNSSTEGAPPPNQAYVNCQTACAKALNTALNAAEVALLTALLELECTGGDQTAALNTFAIAQTQASYTYNECLCACSVANAAAQKVCAGLQYTSCYCAAQKAWDDADIGCTTVFLDGGGTDTATLLSCQNENTKERWTALMQCCFVMNGADSVSPCVKDCAGAQLDCLAGGTGLGEDGKSCSDDYTDCAAACYAPPKMAPCNGCDQFT